MSYYLLVVLACVNWTMVLFKNLGNFKFLFFFSSSVRTLYSTTWFWTIPFNSYMCLSTIAFLLNMKLWIKLTHTLITLNVITLLRSQPWKGRLSSKWISSSKIYWYPNSHKLNFLRKRWPDALCEVSNLHAIYGWTPREVVGVKVKCVNNKNSGRRKCMCLILG